MPRSKEVSGITITKGLFIIFTLLYPANLSNSLIDEDQLVKLLISFVFLNYIVFVLGHGPPKQNDCFCFAFGIITCFTCLLTFPLNIQEELRENVEKLQEEVLRKKVSVNVHVMDESLSLLI